MVSLLYFGRRLEFFGHAGSFRRRRAIRCSRHPVCSQTGLHFRNNNPGRSGAGLPLLSLMGAMFSVFDPGLCNPVVKEMAFEGGY
jgi:hypothetical protein